MINARCLSGNALKILAAIFMVIDHVGLMFFPSLPIFRIIGRLAFPVFAFMISEGARYTKNRLRYFLTMLSLSAVCQIVYFFFDGGSLYMCILVTFSLSILMIYALDLFKRVLFSENPLFLKILCAAAALLVFGAVYLLNVFLEIDYGFAGCLAPVFASVPSFRGIDAPESVLRIDNLFLRILFFAVGLLLLSVDAGGIQYFSLVAIIPLLTYSGKRGKYKMKYFFYLFYPLHLVLLEAIFILTYIIK